MSTGVKNGDIRTMSQYGSSAQYRAQLEWDTDSSTDSTYVLKWIGRAQAQHLSGWGIKVLVEVTGDTSGYSGYTTGSDTGVISYSTSFTTDASVSKTIKIPRGHSSKTIKVKVSAYGVTVDGHPGVTAGTSDYTATFNPGAKPSYTVTYNANGGTNSGSTNKQTKWYGETLTLFKGTNFSKSGYTLFGWGTTSTQTEKSYSLEGNYTKNASDTLYALWKKTITLTYSANGGSGAPNASSYTVYNDTKSHTFTISATKPTRTGYKFLGWNTSSSAASAKYSAGDTISLSSNDTLYAVWERLTYTVSYNPNGTSVTDMPAQQTKNYGVNLTLATNSPARPGHDFINWNTAANGSGTSYNRAATYSANANLILYAQWQVKMYSVSYNANKGSNPPATQAKTYGVNLTLTSSIPTRSGHNFTGWNTESDGTGTSYSPGQVYSANASITLYAQWEVAHQNPQITKLNVIRADQNEQPDDEGTYALLTVGWALDSSVTSATAHIEIDNPSLPSGITFDDKQLTGNSGEISWIIQSNGSDYSQFSKDEAYNISIYIDETTSETTYTSSTKSTFLSKAYFIMDIYGQVEYNEADVSGGFPSGVVLYENNSIKSVTYSENITSVSVNADTFCENYSFDRIRLEFTYSTTTPGWSGTTGDGGYSSNIDLASIGITYVAEFLQDDDYIKIEAEKKYIQTADLTPQQNKKYYTATEPGHGIAFGAPAEYDKFKVGLPIYLLTNTSIYGVDNSDSSNVVTMPMIGSVTDTINDNKVNYINIGSNNYKTNILGSTIDISGATTLSNTLTVSGATTISSDLKLTKGHSIYLNSGDSSPQNKTRIVAADYLGENNIYYDAHGYHALRTWDTTLATPDWKGKFYVYNDRITSNVPIYGSSIYINNHTSQIGYTTDLISGSKTTLSAQTWTTLATITLSKGSWVIQGNAGYESGWTARTGIRIRNTTGDVTLGGSTVYFSPNSMVGRQNTCVCYEVTADNTVLAIQISSYTAITSSDDITINGSIRAMRVA